MTGMKKSMLRFLMFSVPLCLLVSCKSPETETYPFDGVWDFVRIEVPANRQAAYMLWQIRGNRIYVGGFQEGHLEKQDDTWYIIIQSHNNARLKVLFPDNDRMEVPDINGNTTFYRRRSWNGTEKYPFDGVWQVTGFTFSGKMSPHEYLTPKELVLEKHRQPGLDEPLIYRINNAYYVKDLITGADIPVRMVIVRNLVLMKYRISNPTLPYDGYNMVYRKRIKSNSQGEKDETDLAHTDDPE